MTIIERLQTTGIRRTGSPARGFRYRTAKGPVPRAELARIDALKIPPAWTRVAVAPSPKSAVQAVGQDAAGRWQYLYHETHTARRERAKQQRLLRFIAALPRMRRAIARDLRRRGLGREKVLAGILKILGTCFLRPGNQVYADKNGSFGLATLRRQHVSVDGDRVVFDFMGKSKKRQRRELVDPEIARLVRELLRYPGEVFKFRSEDGSMTDVHTGHINAYIKEVMGEQFSAKDFRTWAGSLLCACALARAESERARTKQERKKRIAAALREVAEQLGNTPAVCRSSYVFPAVLRKYEQGRVIGAFFEDVSELSNGNARRVEKSERALIELLR
ncbi:MAG TPA: DNA topoisomerase IB [Candidatus Binatia bacterium]|nr:DNA topoisomerase IB [Candidatus Binatia bacterium]